MIPEIRWLNRWLLVAIAASATLLSPGAVAQTVDLGAWVGWPFPTELVAAREAEAVAWVRNEKGARNVWVAQGPDWTGRRVTDFNRDDGQEITQLRLSADGSRLVFVRGGAPNRSGEIPNPTSDPEGAVREIWAGSVDRGDSWRLGEGSAPVLSRSGDWVLFVDGGKIWRRSTEKGSDDAEPEALVAGRGTPADLVLSPDESRLAWSSRRGTHAFIGVLDLESLEMRYLDPSVDRDGNPTWSPDGGRIAYLRIPNRRDQLLFVALRETVPWSIRVADVSTGAASTAFRAAEGYGSVFRPISATSQLFWGAGDRIVFPWEANGWTNLYSVPSGGGAATPLAEGEYEVQYASISPDRSAMVYSSNSGDINRQHLWRVGVDGSDLAQITEGDGIEWQPAMTRSGSVAFLASAGRVPAHAEVLRSESRSWLAGAAPDSEALVEPEAVIFSATDGMQIHGQLFVPRGTPPSGGWPALLFMHGGSRRQMLLGFHHRGYYHNAYTFNQHMATRGYVVLSVNYRSGIGYGLEFREADNYGADGASEVQDIIGAGLYLRGRDDVNPSSIGLWGGSYGGYLTAHGLARASDLFSAGVDVHGVHDWNLTIKGFIPSYDPAANPEFSRRAFESSPMAAIDGWRSPVLLIHGDDDRNVPFPESVELAEELRERGVHVEQLIFPDEVHGFLLHRNWTAAFDAAAEFFDRFLKGPVS